MARTQYVFAVSNGTIYRIDVSTQTKTTPSGGTSALITGTGWVDSSPGVGGDLFWVDGTNVRRWTAAANTVVNWASAVTAGSFPAHSGNYPRLVALWRSRIVLSGITTDAHNWFMSRQSDPLDWNYGADAGDAQRAVAGNNTDAGLVGDVITALIPYDKDRLIFGGDHTLFLMTGDPTFGGEIELVSSSTGIAFGKAWAMDHNQTVYFYGSDGVYRYIPGGRPENITAGRLDQAMRSVNLSTHRVRLEWDRAFARLHVFVTQIATGTSTHFCWEQRADAWWVDQYPDAHGPISTFVLDADSPNDRRVLLGTRDGYILKLDPAATSDDGTAISSYCFFPPIRKTDGMEEQVLNSLAVTLSKATTNVLLDVYASEEAESLYDSSTSAKTTRTFTRGGRHTEDRRRVRGANLGIKLYNSTLDKVWSVEDVIAEIEVAGKMKKA